MTFLPDKNVFLIKIVYIKMYNMIWYILHNKIISTDKLISILIFSNNYLFPHEST